MRIVHVISEYSRHEAMGRTIAETVARVEGEHHLVTVRAHDGAADFASVHEVGGGFTSFAFTRGDQIEAALREIRPDLVHVHGGALAPWWARARALRSRPIVMSVYGWPRVPRPSSLRRATWRQLTRSNVLRPRVLLSTLIPASATCRMVRHSTVQSILSPDPDARDRLADSGVTVQPLPSGASVGHHRAEWSDNPVVLFAGRAEMVRGIDTLLDAFPLVLKAVPSARLRLLLIPTAELPDVLAAVAAAGLGDSCDVSTEPVRDLEAALADAQVGVWPFKFDYTTSPPAMALAEAMAVGLPVVSTPVTCVRAVARHGDNAMLVRVADEHALADAIVRLVTDRSEWQRLAWAGLSTIEHEASWDAAAATTRGAYGLQPVAVS
jgi:glycosyltransferase involved in cell wall biosynthesis